MAGPVSAQGTAVPVASEDVGPWEALLWAHDGKVHHCSLSRVRDIPPGISYALFEDKDVVLLGIENQAWTFVIGSKVDVVLTPENGEARTFVASAVLPTRIHLRTGRDDSLPNDLQRSEHADLRIGPATMRLAFDDFNAARVVLESCVQRIGAAIPTHDPHEH